MFAIQCTHILMMFFSPPPLPSLQVDPGRVGRYLKLTAKNYYSEGPGLNYVAWTVVH